MKKSTNYKAKFVVISHNDDEDNGLRQNVERHPSRAWH